MEKDMININLEQASELFEVSDFKTEKELVEFVIENQRQISYNIYQSQSLRYLEQPNIRGSLIYIDRPLIADLAFDLEDGRKILIECKNPNQNVRESIIAIGQVLGYISCDRLSNNNYDRYCLITSVFNEIIIKIVQDFNLPIDIIFISKSEMCVIKNEPKLIEVE